MSEDEAASTSSTADVVAEPVEATPRPVLRVVKGELTSEELAALVAVIAARNAAVAHAAARVAKRPRSEWGHPARAHRTPHRVGPDQWRRSAWG